MFYEQLNNDEYLRDVLESLLSKKLKREQVEHDKALRSAMMTLLRGLKTRAHFCMEQKKRLISRLHNFDRDKQKRLLQAVNVDLEQTLEMTEKLRDDLGPTLDNYMRLLKRVHDDNDQPVIHVQTVIVEDQEKF